MQLCKYEFPESRLYRSEKPVFRSQQISSQHNRDAERLDLILAASAFLSFFVVFLEGLLCNGF